MPSYLTNITEIPGAECIGDSRTRINNIFADFKAFLENLYDDFNTLYGETPDVDLEEIAPIVGTACIGESRQTLEFLTDLVKEATKQLQNIYRDNVGYTIEPISLLDVSSIPSTECVGDSRERINFNVQVLKNALIEIKETI